MPAVSSAHQRKLWMVQRLEGRQAQAISRIIGYAGVLGVRRKVHTRCSPVGAIAVVQAAAVEHQAVVDYGLAGALRLADRIADDFVIVLAQELHEFLARLDRRLPRPPRVIDRAAAN